MKEFDAKVNDIHSEGDIFRFSFYYQFNFKCVCKHAYAHTPSKKCDSTKILVSMEIQNKKNQ